MFATTPRPRPLDPGPSSDAIAMMRYDASKKSTLVAYLFWFFLGPFGAHRFYLGRIGTGITMLLLLIVSVLLSVVLIGLFGLLVLGTWWLVDALLIPGMATAYNQRPIDRMRR